MGDVIAFSKPKPRTPAMPVWRRRLLEQWSNPANWSTGQGGEHRGERLGERLFAWGALVATIHRNETDDGYCGWSFLAGHPKAGGDFRIYLVLQGRR
jgi:hypothetical protein